MNDSTASLQSELADALIRHDHAAIERLAESLDNIGTMEASCIALRSRGVLCILRGSNEQAFDLLTRSIALARTIQNQRLVAIGLTSLGSLMHYESRLDEALECYVEAQGLLTELNDHESLNSVLSNIAAVYISQSKYALALTCYYELLDRYEVSHSQRSIAVAYGNIGTVKSLTGNHLAAIADFERALDLYTALDNQAGIARMNGYLGGVYDLLDDIERGLEYAMRSLAIYNSIGTPDDIARVIVSAVEMMIRTNRHEESEELLSKAIALNCADPWITIGIDMCLSAIREHHGDTDTAFALATTALLKAEENSLVEYQAKLHLRLRDLAKHAGDFEGYVSHNEANHRIQQSILSASTIQRLAVIEADHKLVRERAERSAERTVLNATLPRTVIDRLLRGEKVTGDHFPNAAVLFADVVGFSSHTSGMHPSEVVVLLQSLFQSLDDVCELNDVSKVKTIGDSYMAFKADAGALENVYSVAKMACAAMNVTTVWPTGEPLELRIGLHYGPVTAGVIGTQRLQYDVWGDTVNVASRMESSGEAGRIQASDSFARAITASGYADQFILTPRGTIDVKGKGAMETYWLEHS